MVYYHTDVFSSEKFLGNGLTVVFHEEEIQTKYMQKIAEEFKQFETIFLRKIGDKCFRARIFTVEEELDFAGHPILGAVSAIHENFYKEEDHIKVTLELNKKTLHAESTKKDEYYQASMNQGIPQFLGAVEDVATGSAAGPTGAYLYKWNIQKASEDIIINQGRFVGRPSRISVSKDMITEEITVAGDVKIIVKGEFLV